MTLSRRAIEVLFFILPASLVVSRVRIMPLGIPIYIPEMVALAIACCAAVAYKWKAWLHAISLVPPLVLVSGVLIFCGLVSGLIFAPSYLAALGAIKTWFFIPVFLFFTILVVKPRVMAIYSGIILYAVLETVYGMYMVSHAGGILQGGLPTADMYAMVVAPVFILVAYLSLRWPGLWLIEIVLGAGILLSHSVAAIAAICLGLAMWAVCERIVSVRVTIGLLAAICAAALLCLFFNGSYLGMEDFSSLWHFQIWGVSLHMLHLAPLSGVGLRGFATAYQFARHEQAPQTFVPSIVEPFNLYLAFWLNLGLLGLIGFLGFLMGIFKDSWHIPATYALFTVLAMGLVLTPFFSTELAFLFWLYSAGILMEKLTRTNALR
jgi:O-antigen ligase